MGVFDGGTEEWECREPVVLADAQVMHPGRNTARHAAHHCGGPGASTQPKGTGGFVSNYEWSPEEPQLCPRLANAQYISDANELRWCVRGQTVAVRLPAPPSRMTNVSPDLGGCVVASVLVS